MTQDLECHFCTQKLKYTDGIKVTLNSSSKEISELVDSCDQCKSIIPYFAAQEKHIPKEYFETLNLYGNKLRSVYCKLYYIFASDAEKISDIIVEYF